MREFFESIMPNVIPKLPALWNATLETLAMTGISALYILVIGMALGILLTVTKKGGLLENAVVYRVLASRNRIKAKIAGGAVMFATASERFNIGERNIQAVKAALRREGIPIVAEDTGLNYGRTVFFYPETGIMEIRAASMGNKQL